MNFKEEKVNIMPLYSGNPKKIIHRVRSGESIWLIAGQYHVSVNNIKEWNNISGSRIKQG